MQNNITLNGNYWYVSNMILDAGSLEELEKRANNLKLSLRKPSGGFLSAPEIRAVIQGYFDKLYPGNAKAS